MLEVYLQAGGVKSLWLNSDEFFTYCKEKHPEIKDVNDFDGDDEPIIIDFIDEYLQKKHWDSTFFCYYAHETETFNIYKISIPKYKLKMKG